MKSIKKAPKKAVPTKTPREMSVLKGEWRILNADMESIIERSSNCILPSPEEKAARARKRISNVRPYSSWFYPVFWEKMPCTDEEALRDLRNMRSKLTAEVYYFISYHVVPSLSSLFLSSPFRLLSFFLGILLTILIGTQAD